MLTEKDYCDYDTCVALREFEEFKALVRKMREAQNNYYKDRKIEGARVAYKNMINKEYWVDEYLKKLES